VTDERSYAERKPSCRALLKDSNWSQKPEKTRFERAGEDPRRKECARRKELSSNKWKEYRKQKDLAQ
jgi:hypothetical protein